MQRFVGASSASVSSPVLPPVTAWKKARDCRDGRLLRAQSVGLRRNNVTGNHFNIVSQSLITRGGRSFSVPCCPQGLGCGGSGREGHDGRSICLPGLKVSSSGSHGGLRSLSVSRGALGKRHGGADPADSHPERHLVHHRGQQRNHRQVVDSIRDFRAESWWTNDDADDDSEEDGTLAAAELWTSQIILQLSLFWNLLGYSPSRVDEWLVSNEARRRLNSLNSRNRFLSPLSSLTPVNSRPLGDSLDGNSAIAEGSNSVRFSELFAAALPSFSPQERLAEAMEGLKAFVYPKWLFGMSQTYGTSFILLVALGYILQGFRCFPWFAVGYMLKDGLQVDPGYMQFLLSSAALPMVLKPIYGIVSDTVYIQGAHRVPYLAIAGVLQLISWGALALSPYATSSAVLFTAALTFGNLGAAIADVMNDALVAEVSKKQKGGGKGELQSFAWLIMASGGLFGNLLGGFALKRLELTSMYFIFLCLLGLHFITCFFVNESSFDLAPPSQPSVSSSKSWDGDVVPAGLRRRSQAQQTRRAADGSGFEKTTAHPSLGTQLKDQVALLAKLLKNKEISHLLIWFCASYAMIPILGSSIFFFQTQVLQIDPTFIGMSRMVGQVGLMVGSQLYGGLLKGLPIRKLLGGVQFLLSFCMLSDLLLVKRVNLQFGIPDSFYVLGVSALVDCVSQFKVLPVIVRLGQLCPPGSEGSLMAFFSSCHCLAGLCSGYFGVALAKYLRISSQSFEGLPLGILIQATFTLLPILFISLIPGEESSKLEQVPEKVRID